ncbi:MAG: translation initiation factor IF-3 [Candidatus Yanofskybacteria bacterium]|nr:translation initiation factor IF-3 [Candidatus Yanofskybacteria bacterium]
MQKNFNKRVRLNNQIRESQIQVIDADGKQLGTIPTHEALRLANERGLDLVEVGPMANPPIAKIMDYGKYMYQKEKREKGGKTTKVPSQEIKTVRIGFRTGTHDLMVRAGQADKFLQKGHRVRLELTLRGREKSMADIGRSKLESLIKMVSEPFVLEEPAKRSPVGFGVLIRPEHKK